MIAYKTLPITWFFLAAFPKQDPNDDVMLKQHCPAQRPIVDKPQPMLVTYAFLSRKETKF